MLSDFKTDGSVASFVGEPVMAESALSRDAESAASRRVIVRVLESAFGTSPHRILGLP